MLYEKKYKEMQAMVIGLKALEQEQKKLAEKQKKAVEEFNKALDELSNKPKINETQTRQSKKETILRQA